MYWLPVYQAFASVKVTLILLTFSLCKFENTIRKSLTTLQILQINRKASEASGLKSFAVSLLSCPNGILEENFLILWLTYLFFFPFFSEVNLVTVDSPILIPRWRQLWRGGVAPRMIQILQSCPLLLKERGSCITQCSSTYLLKWPSKHAQVSKAMWSKSCEAIFPFLTL